MTSKRRVFSNNLQCKTLCKIRLPLKWEREINWGYSGWPVVLMCQISDYLGSWAHYPLATHVSKVGIFFLALHVRVYSGISGFLPLLRKRKRNPLEHFGKLCSMVFPKKCHTWHLQVKPVQNDCLWDQWKAVYGQVVSLCGVALITTYYFMTIYGVICHFTTYTAA